VVLQLIRIQVTSIAHESAVINPGACTTVDHWLFSHWPSKKITTSQCLKFRLSTATTIHEPCLEQWDLCFLSSSTCAC